MKLPKIREAILLRFTMETIAIILIIIVEVIKSIICNLVVWILLKNFKLIIIIVIVII